MESHRNFSPDDRTSRCLAHVRQWDRDRYLSLLFAPSSLRPPLAALYAVNCEIARAREMVTQPLLGFMRLQWWRDTLAGIYQDKKQPNEFAEALRHAVTTYGLDQALWEQLLMARELDMTDELPATLQELEDYAAATAGNVIKLALQILIPDPGVRMRLDNAAYAAGVGGALVGLLRAVPFMARMNRLYMPQELLDREGVTRAQFLADPHRPEARKIVGAVLDRAGVHLQEFARAWRDIPRSARSGFVPGLLAESYARRLRAAQCDVTAPGVQQSPPWQIWPLAFKLWL